MSDHDQLPEQHRAYVLARANVLSCAERSTAALDALVARGYTDAEELPLRERRYLAARGGMLRGGQDPAFLDVLVEGVLDQHEAQALARARTGPARRPGGPRRSARSRRRWRRLQRHRVGT